MTTLTDGVPTTATGNRANFRRCLVDGCDGPFYARQMCLAHYEKWRRAGKPDRYPVGKPRPRLPASFRRTTG